MTATREQLTKERLDALIDLIIEENETPAGELPSPKYLESLKYLREFNEAKKYCEYCRNAGEHLKDYQ